MRPRKEVRFEASQREEVYGWVERLLCQHEYPQQGRRAKGLLRRYIGKMTGLSRAQFTRLMGRYVATGRVRIKPSRRPSLSALAIPRPTSNCWPKSMKRTRP